MNRGARRAPVLGDDEARALFLDVLGELPARFGVVVHGYALMPNHYHLLLGTPRGNLSRAMRHLGAVFTQRLNAAREWDGPVFRGRFKNRLVGDGRYWMHLLAYVHLNPVPTLAALPSDWAWSSHRAYVGLAEPPPWLTRSAYLAAFGSPEGIGRYIEEQRTGLAGPPEGWDEAEIWRPESTSVTAPPMLPSESRASAVNRALDQIVEVTGCDLAALTPSHRGRRDNRPRWVAAWWITRRAGLSQREAAHYLDCSSASIANMLWRLRRVEDEEVSRWMATLEEVGRPTR